MKKYFIIGAVIVVLGLLINYSLGGFAPVEPQKVDVTDYTIWGEAFEGSYKSSELVNLVERMHNLQHKFNGAADVVIVNYFDEGKETIGTVNNFVGLRSTEALPDSITAGLEKRTIKANAALRVEVKIKPLVMPSPEKVKNKAFDLAKTKGLKLQNLSVEQYLETGVLVVEFPIEYENE